MSGPIDLTAVDTDGMSEDDLRALAAKAQASLRSRDAERAAAEITAIATMSDEDIAALVRDHEDRYDECDDFGGYDGWHNEKKCPACVGRATLAKRQRDHERTLPGADTSNSFMTREAQHIIVTDLVKFYPNPGSKQYHYVEAMDVQVGDDSVRVMWRKTNTEERWVEGTYDRGERLDIHRTYPRIDSDRPQ